jgi:PAS domain S-box-containing protein
MQPELVISTDAGAVLARQQKRGFSLVASIFIALLLLSLAASWAAIDVVNSTRAYATGEGRYSKAQKIAVLKLHHYAEIGQAQDYLAFLQAITVPRGDRAARLAMEAKTLDVTRARAGLLQGQNHPDDLQGMVRLFRLFGWWKPFAAAVADWRQGDALVEELMALGAALNHRIATGPLAPADRVQLLSRIDDVDNRLTALENTFSTHMGEAARTATGLVVLGLGGAMILLWTIGMAFATRLLREQLALDRQLGSSEQRFRDFAEVASDWYWESDADHRLVFMSERFHSVLGDAVRRSVDDYAEIFLKLYADGAMRSSDVTAFAERRPFRDMRVRFPNADGRDSYWSLSGKPVYDATGNFLGYRGVGSDVTELVNDARVLRQEKERAEIANRAKSDFLANVSHELRTPLNAILGFSEIIMNQLFGADATKRYASYAGDIHLSGKHLLGIIDEILDLSKIEAGHTKLETDEICVAEIARATRSMLRDRFQQAGLNFALELPGGHFALRVDERRLKQALLNLLSNALKFTPQGGTVTLTAIQGPDDGFSFIVRDTGIGIAAKDIDVVLAPFGQVESAFSRRHHGTGLGLPLARALIELHGGRLSLESEVGVGTVVTLWLPPERLIDAVDHEMVAQPPMA